MRRRSALAVGSLLLAVTLAGCATPTAAGSAPDGSATAPAALGEPTSTPTTSPTPLDPEAAAARAKAQGWLDAAALPPGAVRSEKPVGGYGSFTGWPCGPVEEIEAYWTVPDISVADTAIWLRDHPTADLITSTPWAFDDPTISSAIVGYIPAPEAQEGVVYTIAKSGDGVAVRAEIAALTASGSCPPLPDGAVYGAPGQG